ncbi:MAG: BspA family leucine-rich repeat surface protein [Bdellovibrionota bacterium]
MKTKRQYKWTIVLFLPFLAIMIACGGEGTINNDVVTPQPVVPTVPTVPTVSDPAPFISKWLIDSAGQSITLPLRSEYSYDFTVDWGDGSPIAEVTSTTDVDITHVYAVAGEYEVTIKGLVESWYFNDSGDKDALIEVIDLGDVGWKNLSRAFYGCSNLVSFAGGNTSEVVDMSWMFYKAFDLESVDVSSFDTSKVIDMSAMFGSTDSLVALDLSSFDTSMVNSMDSMFYSASSLTSLDVSSFDTSNVEFMGYMFAEVQSMITLDLSNFNTSNVIDMDAMFYSAYSLTSLNISSFNTSNVKYMAFMFAYATSLINLYLSHFDTTKVQDMAQMFRNTNNLAILEANGWDITNATTSSNVFLNAGNGVSGGIKVYCDQGGSPGTGTLFGKTCN